MEWFEQANQAAQPNASTTWQNSIAKNGNYQRACLHAALLPKVGKVFLDGINHWEVPEATGIKACILAALIVLQVSGVLFWLARFMVLVLGTRSLFLTLKRYMFQNKQRLNESLCDKVNLN
ncbi:MAG: hypothetical protein HHJ17_04365 [Rhodoferax sp.]|nr:hypothetical protein [Rhodoferax sp.]NMM19890.1 hypothetical protein [Rhodoferax sp.]